VQLNLGLLKEGWAEEFIGQGWATPETILEMSEAWLSFARTPGAFLAMTWCEAISWK
jgi:hypothetical protein